MYKHYIKYNSQPSLLMLPYNIPSVIEDWTSLRKAMIFSMPEQFTRNEWAYLISFLDLQNLHRIYRALGEMTDNPEKETKYFIRPKGVISLWLPNNISMLGPLTLIILSMSGNVVRIKTGSKSQDLVTAFIHFVNEHLNDGELKEYLNSKITISSFNRADKRNVEMANESQVRIVFGSDEAAKAIDTLPHPVNSIGIYFTNKQSQIWLDREHIDENTIDNIIKIFEIYGQAGCTSPRKIIIIDGNKADTLELKSRIIRRWPKIILRKQPQHIASSNIMTQQLGAVLGWDTELTENNGAVIAAGNYGLSSLNSFMLLPIMFGSLEEAAQNLPDNIQTIGHNFSKSKIDYLLPYLQNTKTKRLVPISMMHDFGPIWDGYEFFRQLFEITEVEYE
jgi:hypothetical protein